MAGKYIPMATSSRRKARKEMMVSVGVAPGLNESYSYISKMSQEGYLAVTQQMAMLADIIIRHIFRMWASEKPLLLRIEKRALPTMMQTMKQEKTIPRGVEPVSRTGVQRNTKMYMQDSRSDWQDPSSNT